MNYLLRIIIIALSLAMSSSLSFAQKITRQEYIEKFKDLAIKEMADFRIPASIILAQGCLESADGNSRLATEANNHFGIKCSNWTGDTIQQHDDRRNECFRKYKNVEQSYTDHSLFLVSRDRYARLFKLDITDYKAWATGLQETGYATNPRYAEQLIKIIEDYSLFRFDGKEDKTYKNIILPDAVKVNDQDKKSDSLNAGYSFTLDRSILKNNKVKYIISSEQDSYESLAKEFGLFKRELLSFNDIRSEDVLKPGTILYIEKKKRKYGGAESIYVIAGEKSYREIAQKYGIRLKNLLKMNSLKESDTPVQGKSVKLK
jgi:LysM repeat protein